MEETILNFRMPKLEMKPPAEMCDATLFMFLSAECGNINY